jgi:hypothetical protein
VSTQARPKYTVEEYPLVFVYDTNITSVPTFSIKLLSGIDPVKEAMLGPAVVSRNLVALFIYGGVAGCIYEISCVADEIEKTARVAVLPTAATAPPSGGLPFLHRVNSMPYPVIYRDEISLGFSVIGGSIDVLVVPGTVEDDAVSLDFGIVEGYLSLPPTGNVEESIDLSFSVLGGLLKTSPVGEYEDAVSLGIAIQSGLMKPGPTGTFLDEIDLSISIVEGTLHVP